MRFAAAGFVLLSLMGVTRAEGQEAHSARVFSEDTVRIHQSVLSGEFGFGVVGVVTRASPAHVGRTITEGYITQPNLMGDVRYSGARGDLQLLTTLNFEGYTLRRGELNAGMYGEGYVDRRHPHTFAHEAMLSYTTPTLGAVRLSLAGGKGFTPYGTDDPMMRPFVLYPVNHHHAQIIERVQAIGALSVGTATRGIAIEHGIFNGDEPYAPFAGPRWSRFGDSHATRVTVRPVGGLELQTSRAFVKSPGIVQGGAFDHVQQSSSLRLARTNAEGASRTLLVEFARTDESLDGARVFRFESLLAEGLVEHRGWRLALRAERTERPENERLLDPFRTTAGHIDFQIIGVTRWQIATVHIAAPGLPFPQLLQSRLTPFVEVARAHAAARRHPAVFEPAEFYGNATQYSLNIGAQLHLGRMRHRMGRYGVLAEERTRHASMHSMMH